VNDEIHKKPHQVHKTTSKLRWPNQRWHDCRAAASCDGLGAAKDAAGDPTNAIGNAASSCAETCSVSSMPSAGPWMAIAVSHPLVQNVHSHFLALCLRRDERTTRQTDQSAAICSCE
jgi:hypothetical protein